MKKILALLLALVLLMPAGAAYAWEEPAPLSMEEALIKAKTLLNIPDTITEFDQRHQELDSWGKKVTVYSFEWFSEDRNQITQASVDSLGNFIDAYIYTDSLKSGLIKVNREGGRATAKQFLNKALPELAPGMKEINESENAAQTYWHAYTFCYYHEGVPVPDITVNIYIDKYTGKLVNYRGLTPGFTLPSFSRSTPGISLEDAKNSYLDAFGIELNYQLNYNYRNTTATVFPAYELVNPYGAIDAATGEAIHTSVVLSLKEIDAVENESLILSYDRATGLSEIEIASLEVMATLISSDRALRTVKNNVPLLADQELLSASLENDYYTNNYLWQLRFEEGSASVGAETGELLSFYVYTEGEEGPLTSEQAQEKAEAFLKKIAPDKWAQVRLSEVSNTADRFYLSIYNPISNQYTFTYHRFVNDVPFKSNYMTLSVDQQGNLLNYTAQWLEETEFASLENVIAIAEAYTIFNEYGNFGLSYQLDSNFRGKLVYRFENPVPYFVDPLSGKKITRFGEEFTRGGQPEYKDLSGHWVADIVQALLENGYRLETDDANFHPENSITHMGFLKYLYPMAYMDDESHTEYILNSVLNTPRDFQPNKELTRQEAAKYLVQYLGLETAAKRPEIFAPSASDTIAEAYAGYVALALGLEMMDTNEDGIFAGETALTRGEAAQAIYQALKLQ